jgi:hypothetical protein
VTMDSFEQLKAAIDSLNEPIYTRADLHGVEPVLDGIVSALSLFWGLPKQSREFAVPLDEALAYLAKQKFVPLSAVAAANTLIECAGRVSYDPDADGTLDEANDSRAELYEELVKVLEQLRKNAAEEESEDD